jgi:hypothetical protein
MKFILFIVICANFLFSIIIDNKYIISENALSSLINSSNIYQYIEQNPIKFNKLKEKSFFSFSEFNIIKSKKNSSYKNFYVFKYKNDDFVYIKIPAVLLKDEFDLYKYRLAYNNSYILRFKKEFIKNKLTYLSLDIGEKRRFKFTFNSKDIFEFLQKHSNLLFEKEDLFDSVSIQNNKISFTTNYTQKEFNLNFYLKDFISIHKKKIISKKINKSFLLKMDDRLPSLKCEDKELLNYIPIDNEKFIIGEEKTTSSIYSLYLLSNKDKLNEYLKKNIHSINTFSILKDKNIHTLSYKYKTENIKIFLKLPKGLSYDIKSKFISSFNSFKFKINGTLFDGYIDKTNIYPIAQEPCPSTDKRISILNIKNYSEYAKWNIQIDDKKKSITWTPSFNIYKINPIIYAPFLLKKKNKYVINSMVDENSKMKGEIKYAYIYNNVLHQNKALINPKTNTNFYFKYPKDTNISNILDKTKFTYNSNPIRISSSEKYKIRFSAKKANKIALVYIPTGNINSFRKYFLRYYECSQEEMQDNETCFNYLADMESGIDVFLSKLRKSKKYSQILYRKNIFKENNKENLLIFDRENRSYAQATDEEVLGKNYDNYKWKLLSSLSYDKKILKNYELRNIDLIYFSNINIQNTKTLSTLNNYGFNKVFLINFGENISNAFNKYKNIRLIHHKYNKPMDSKVQELDIGIFKNILKQIINNK